jgi:hypothetical protein
MELRFNPAWNRALIQPGITRYSSLDYVSSPGWAAISGQFLQAPGGGAAAHSPYAGPKGSPYGAPEEGPGA